MTISCIIDFVAAGSPRLCRVSSESAAVRAAVRDGLLGEQHPVAAFLDVDGIRATVADVHAAFADVPALHTFAVKACSLVPVLRLLSEAGMGCEVASRGELALARAAGVPDERIVFDSPAKTRIELAEALGSGIAVNADNFAELDRIGELTGSSVCGLRVNPQVGAGSIGAMSTAYSGSKFGVPLHDSGAMERILAAFTERPWLTRLHVHVGSQGCPLELIAEGVGAAHRLAERINEHLGERRVTSLDIGGGLPVNFEDDRVTPSFAEYARVLRTKVPGLFDGTYELVTEFGRSIVAKHGFIAARVEYTKDSGGRRIAVTHAGAQVATRTVFMPESWPLRVSVFDALGNPKQGRELAQDIAGPCCFAGDLVASGRMVPELEAGDLVVLHDTGGYYASTPWSYNSLPRPAIHGYGAAQGFRAIRTEQTIEALLAESGVEHVESLVTAGVSG